MSSLLQEMVCVYMKELQPGALAVGQSGRIFLFFRLVQESLPAANIWAKLKKDFWYFF